MTSKRTPLRSLWEEDSIAATIRTTASAQVNQVFTSQIDRSGDVDWVRVQLLGQRTYQIYLDGQDSNSGTLTDPLLRGIYDSRGRMVNANLTDDDSGHGKNAYLTFTPSSSGTFFIAAAAYGSAKGTYSLMVANDTTPPELLSVLAGNDSLAVSLDESILLNFSEEIRLGQGFIRLINDQGPDLEININDSSQIFFDGQYLTINPTGLLYGSSTYQLQIDAGAILDRAGNAYVPSQNLFTFETVSANTPAEPPIENNPPALKQWTVMVYLAADNDLESFALMDVNEMESIVGPGHLGITALLDRNQGYSTASGDWHNTRMANIISDTGNNLLSFDSVQGAELDTGLGQTLTDFILWSIENQPAENYALVIWDHGAGIDGIAWDDSSGGYLSIAEVSSAIHSAVNHSDLDNLTKFDIVAMDACLMGMVEVAHPLTPLADYFVASQELVPGEGFAYDEWLDIFSTDVDVTAEELVNSALQSYATEYASQSDITISALDLSQMNELVQALNNFTALAVRASTRDLRAITKVVAGATDFPSDQSYDFADLGHAMDLIAANRTISNQGLKLAAQQVSNSIDQLVIGELGSVSSASGVSIYLPYANEPVASSYNSQSFSFLEAVPLWDDFLRVI
jgi:hypothetical protein